MPKRKSKSLAYYEAKIRKLQKKCERRRHPSDSSSIETERNQDVGDIGGYTFEAVHEPEQEILPEPTLTTEPEPQSVTEQLAVAGSEPGGPSNSKAQPEVNPDLLAALGDASEDTPVFGEDIHNSLAQRWSPILKKGILKEEKDKLFKEYPVPNNCRLIKAPTLNPEISAAVADVVRNRDKSIFTKQDQLGHGIAAISKAISLLLIGEDKIKAVKILSDGCRLLTDLHYIETQLRTKLITPCLQKSILSVIENQNRDDTLFGSDLPEKIKSSKAIEKQGHLIKKTINKAPITTTQTIPRARYQENWQGPPRYPSASRGARGGQHHRPAAPQYRRPPTTSAPMTSRVPNNPHRQRAPRQ